MQKSKTYLCVTCICLLLGVVMYQTSAYFTKESTTTNAVSTGYVEMQLDEKIQSDGVHWEFIPTGEVMSIKPGDSVGQKPYVTNVGTEDFYARVSYKIDVVDKNGKPLSADVVSVNIDPTKWVLDKDGWYRYINVIPVGEQTPDPLFTEVHFSTEMDNQYIGSTMTITVGSQSVQSEYNTYNIEQGETILDVNGFSTLPAKGKGGNHS